MIRSTFTILCVLSLVGPLTAADDLAVLPTETGGVSASRMLYTYLQNEAQKKFDARRQAVAALKTADDVQRRQEYLRLHFLEALGGFPEKTPLRAQVVGQEKYDGYRLERVIYESRPDHHVTAVLYLPEGKGPFPGVLLPCGHDASGKAAAAYQRVCILMAKNGLAVLCYDPIGQGERIQLLDRQGKPLVGGGTSEHTMAGVGALLVGGSTATYRIWDGMRSLDYLASRPEIDPQRLGCTGNSGGGTLTAYLMALDDRIVAAAPSCYITSLERLLATIGPQDAEQNITGQIAFGMEHADYVTLRVPKPTLLCVGTQDFFDIQGSWTTFREVKQLYGMLGHGERMDLFEYNDKHGFSKPRREAAMRWMRRWLLKLDDAPVESDFPILKEEQLRCTRTGQVLEDFKDRSVFDLNAARATELARQREQVQTQRSREELLKEVRRLIAVPETVPAAKVQRMGKLEREAYEIEKIVFETEPGIRVPGLLFTPKKAAHKGPLMLYLDGDGKAALGSIEKRVLAGQRVLSVDLRGWGETAPGKVAKDRPSYFGADQREAFLGVLLNRPLLGQRVQDVLALIAALAEQEQEGFHVLGVGAAGPVALHAAALEPRIKEVTLERAVVSWSAVAQTPLGYNQLTNVVPGALKVYDVPELTATLAPRPLTIQAAVDPLNQVVTQEKLEEVYAACKRSYARQKAEKALLLHAGS